MWHAWEPHHTDVASAGAVAGLEALDQSRWKVLVSGPLDDQGGRELQIHALVKQNLGVSLEHRGFATPVPIVILDQHLVARVTRESITSKGIQNRCAHDDVVNLRSRRDVIAVVAVAREVRTHRAQHRHVPAARRTEHAERVGPYLELIS